MMKSRFINYFPVRENHRSKAISTLESKRYGKAIKLSHVQEEKDGFIYLKGYLHNSEFKRVKYDINKMNKVRSFYSEIRKFLQDSFYNFELLCYQGKSEFSAQGFMEYIKNARKNFDYTKEIRNDLGLLNDIAIILQKLASYKYSVPKISLLQLAIELTLTIRKHDPEVEKTFIIELEFERVKFRSIRDICAKCEIKSFLILPNIEEFKNKVLRTSVEDFINDLKQKKTKLIDIFVDHLIDYGKTLE